MAAKGKSLEFKQLIQAPAAQAYRAFTNAAALREWLCDVASVAPVKGGRVYLCWNAAYYTSGEFVSVVPGKKVVFTWHGRGEPAPTQVQVALAVRKTGTQVTLTHTGIGSGKAWAGRADVIARGWEVGLENLQSVLETGVDLRITRRPMLGIWLGGEIKPENAAKFGVPVARGVRLEGVIDGMGAQAAGLKANDVLVGLGGKKITGYASFGPILQGKNAGDVLSAVYYRDGEKRTARFQLSSRRLPEVPATPDGLASVLQRTYAEGDAELDQCFEGVSEEAASRQPAPGEWSARQVLAHLITGERDGHNWIGDQIGDQERWSDEYGGNVQARLDAVLAVYPTVPELLAEVKRSEAETVKLVAALPDEFVARKGSYWRLAVNLAQGNTHTHEHAGQIRAAIAAAKGQ